MPLYIDLNATLLYSVQLFPHLAGWSKKSSSGCSAHIVRNDFTIHACTFDKLNAFCMIIIVLYFQFFRYYF